MSTETANNYEKYFLLSDEGVLSLQPAYRGEGNSDYSFSLRGDTEPASDFPEILEIPTAIGEDQVISLAPGMFYGNTRVKEIKLLATVTTIPEAFCCEAANLEAIDVNGVITTIGKDAFKSTKIKEALFPDLTTLGESAFSACTCLEVADIGQVTEIPKDAFANCALLRKVSTGEVTSIGASAFKRARIRQALFPNLNTLGEYAFLWCSYLEVADIGQVTTIPYGAFGNCALLRQVIWKAKEVGEGEKVEVTIESLAFYQTRSLRELPLLAYVTKVEDGAFYYSRICTSLPTGGNISPKAFPTVDNTTDFWSGVKFTPHRNRIITRLSQENSKWKGRQFLLDDGRTYAYGCALFAVMHIHSAITGQYYSHPEEFVGELSEDPVLSKFLYENNWPGYFHNVAPMFEALGYRAEVYGNGSDLSRQDYQALVDALADGAYIYTQVGTYNSWMGDWDTAEPNGGHAVVIYGINDLGEVCVLDSNVPHEHYRDYGFEPDIDIYTYTIPYHNIVGPSSNFVIVYPPMEEPAVACKDCAAINACAPCSQPKTACSTDGNDGMPVYNNLILHGTLPSELPTGVNVSVVSTEPEWKLFPEEQRGYLTTYNVFSSAAYAREEWQPNGSNNMYIRHAKNYGEWNDWRVITSASYTPQAGEKSSEDQ